MSAATETLLIIVDDGPEETTPAGVRFYGYEPGDEKAVTVDVLRFTVSPAHAERIEEAVILHGQCLVRVPANRIIRAAGWSDELVDPELVDPDDPATIDARQLAAALEVGCSCRGQYREECGAASHPGQWIIRKES